MLPWLIVSVMQLTVFIIQGVFWFFFFLSIPGKEYALFAFMALVFLAGQGSGVVFFNICSQLKRCVPFFSSGHLHNSGHLLSVLSD